MPETHAKLSPRFEFFLERLLSGDSLPRAQLATNAMLAASPPPDEEERDDLQQKVTELEGRVCSYQRLAQKMKYGDALDVDPTPDDDDKTVLHHVALALGFTSPRTTNLFSVLRSIDRKSEERVDLKVKLNKLTPTATAETWRHACNEAKDEVWDLKSQLAAIYEAHEYEQDASRLPEIARALDIYPSSSMIIGKTPPLVEQILDAIGSLKDANARLSQTAAATELQGARENEALDGGSKDKEPWLQCPEFNNNNGPCCGSLNAHSCVGCPRQETEEDEDLFPETLVDSCVTRDPLEVALENAQAVNDDLTAKLFTAMKRIEKLEQVLDDSRPF